MHEIWNILEDPSAVLGGVKEKAKEIIRKTEIYRVKSEKEVLVPYNRLKQYEGLELNLDLSAIEVRFGKFESGQNSTIRVTKVEVVPTDYDGELNRREQPIRGNVWFNCQIVKSNGIGQIKDVSVPFYGNFNEVKTYNSREEYRQQNGDRNARVRFSETSLTQKIANEIMLTMNTDTFRSSDRGSLEPFTTASPSD